MAHIQEILWALHLDTIHTEYYTFRSKDAPPKVQIDLVIDRSDDFVDIIEIKFSRISFGMTKEESERMNELSPGSLIRPKPGRASRLTC